MTVALSDSGESVRSVRSLHNEPQQGQANLSALEPRRVHVVLRKEDAKSGSSSSGWSARSVHLADVGGDGQRTSGQHAAPALAKSRGRAGSKVAAMSSTAMAARPLHGTGWRSHAAWRRGRKQTTACDGAAGAAGPRPTGAANGRGARVVDEAIMMDLICATEEVDLERSGAAPASSVGEAGQGVVGDDVLDLNCGDDTFAEESSTVEGSGKN